MSLISNLNKRAELRLDPTKSLQMYMRSAELLFRQASIYAKEKDLINAYILYMKFSNLVIGLLPKHPKYNLALVMELRKKAALAMDEIDRLKPLLKEMEQKQLEEQRRVEEEREAEVRRRKEEESKKQSAPVISNPLPAIINDPNWYKSTVAIDYASKNQYTPTPSIPVNIIASNETLITLNGPPLPPKPAGLVNQLNSLNLDGPPLPPKPIVHTDSSQSMLPDGVLRKLHVPDSLVSQFLHVASSNTKRNLETCGILCGHLQKHELYITHLLIPPQTATSDSCSTTDEVGLFLYQDEHNLMTFGWIHTHPTQTCFMSSVDVHTQCSYQMLMPEAISIVCAPSKKPSVGVFRLTDPPGIDIVSDCHHPDMFHQHHREDEIYEEANVIFESGSVVVKDLRK